MPLSQYLLYGTVRDTFVGGIADVDSDPLNIPDLVGVQGTVTFTPSVSLLGFPIVPETLAMLPVVATYDPSGSGQLTLDGQPFVKLYATDNPYTTRVTWTWTVSFSVTVNGISVARPGFSFSLPSASNVDLTSLSPVTTSNGVPVIVGPQGAAGTGLIPRGILVGSNVAVLPTGYGAAQNGYLWRIRSADNSFDELYAWSWVNNSGTYVDMGPAAVSSAISDTTSTTTTTYSSAQIDSMLQQLELDMQSFTSNSIVALPSGVGVTRVRIENLDGSWPLRSADATDSIIWIGLAYPPTSTGYCLPGHDIFMGVDSLS